MPISRIKSNAINDGAITIAKTNNLFVNTEITGTEAARMPQGTTAQRASAQSGDIRFNSTNNLMEYYNGTIWKSIDSPPVISNVDYPGDDTAALPAGGQTITLTGDNFATTGAVTVEINGVAASSVSVASATSLSFTAPAGSAGDVTLEVINPSGLSGRTTFSYSGSPVWNTAVDTILADITNGDVVNNTALQATDDGSTSGVTYALTTGSLPGGLSLNTSTCAITGTFNASAITAFTTFTFTITATDDDNQSTARQFKITGSPNYFGDGSDGDLST